MTSAAEQQGIRLSEAHEICLQKLNQTLVIAAGHCAPVWDSILCWDSTPPNTTAHQQCPLYIFGFNHNESAYKTCTEDGIWYHNGENHWTNYTGCMPKSHVLPPLLNPILIPHIENFRLISKIGYSVSFATLLIAFFVLTFVKRLRCPRNNLHLQLFASFMIRSFMFIMKYWIDSRALPSYGPSPSNPLSLVNSDESLITAPVITENPTYSCKIFTIIWQYSLVANYNWILMEGLYLHNLIFFHIFNDNSSIMRYIILGWGLPIIFIIPWVVVRTYFENTFCWTTNEDKRIFWIIRGPITATIILNFVFFINITRVLFVKMFSSSVSVRQYKYKTWFKSTFILVPLFGVHYMFLLVFNSLSMSYDIFEIIWLYIDLLFSSFQGCVVALLYCFFNGEVQTELHKLWQSWRRSTQKPYNHNSTTHMSYLTQSLTYLSRGRNSCFSTAATAADSSTLGHKEAANSQSRSPSPSSRLRSTQIVTQSMNYSLRDDNRHNSPKTSIRSGDTSNMSAIVIVCDKQSYLNGNNSGPTVDSNQESMM